MMPVRFSQKHAVVPALISPLGLLSALLCLAPAVNAADWPQYRGVHGDGKSAESIGATDWKSGGAKVLWKTKTPLGFSSFAVAGGKLFTIIAADDKEVVLALDAANGDELWQVSLGSSKYDQGGGNAGAANNKGGDGPRSTPAIVDDHVYVYDSYMMLTCFDAKSGNLVWQQDVLKDHDGRNIKWLNATSPVIDGDVVYVSGGGAGQTFLAFNRNNGELLWKSGDETITHATPTLATIHGKKQLVFFVQSGLVGVEAATGKELWRSEFPFSVSTAASPIVSGDLVYCSAGYGVGAGLFKVLPSGKVDVVWDKPNELMNHWSTPVVHDGHLYGIFEFKKYGRAPLQCVELETGEIKWTERGFGPGNCILVGEKLVVLSDAGEVAIVSASTEGYQELARQKVIEGKCWSTPSYSDGRIYVRSTKEAACIAVD